MADIDDLAIEMNRQVELPPPFSACLEQIDQDRVFGVQIVKHGDGAPE